MNDVPNEIEPRVETRDPLIASLLANFAFIRDSAKDQARSIKILQDHHTWQTCALCILFIHFTGHFYKDPD